MLDMLINDFGYNTPIFLNELRVEGITESALRQNFRRMVEKGSIVRFDDGIYYIPKTSVLFNKPMSLDETEVIIAKYIRRNEQVYGYYTGMTFANQIGVTTQVPVLDEITTNKESSKGRNVSLSGSKLRLKCPKVPVTKENWKLLQLLDLLNELEKWSELSKEEAYEKIAYCIKERGLKRDDMTSYVGAYPNKVSKTLIESRLIYVFAS